MNQPEETTQEPKTKIQLSKGLKLQKRLAGRFAEVTGKIQLKNSVLKEQAGQTNIQSLIELKAQLSEALVDLKFALYKGNAKVQERLFILAEKKGEVDFYRNLNIREGVERHSYQNTSVEYVAFIKEELATQKVKELEKEIDRLQDQIDEYNYTTKIEIKQSTLDLGS